MRRLSRHQYLNPAITICFVWCLSTCPSYADVPVLQSVQEGTLTFTPEWQHRPEKEKVAQLQLIFHTIVKKQGHKIVAEADETENLVTRAQRYEQALQNFLVAGAAEAVIEMDQQIFATYQEIDEAIYLNYYQARRILLGIDAEGDLEQARRLLSQVIDDAAGEPEYKAIGANAKQLVDMTRADLMQRARALALLQYWLEISFVEDQMASTLLRPKPSWQLVFPMRVGLIALLTFYLQKGMADTLDGAFTFLKKRYEDIWVHGTADRDPITFDLYGLADKKKQANAVITKPEFRSMLKRWCELRQTDPIAARFDESYPREIGITRRVLGYLEKDNKYDTGPAMFKLLLALERIDESDVNAQAELFVEMGKVLRKAKFYDAAEMVWQDQQGGPGAWTARYHMAGMLSFPSAKLRDLLTEMLLIDVPLVALSGGLSEAAVRLGVRKFAAGALHQGTKNWLVRSCAWLKRSQMTWRGLVAHNALVAVPFTGIMYATDRLRGKPVTTPIYAQYLTTAATLVTLGGIHVLHEAGAAAMIKRMPYLKNPDKGAFWRMSLRGEKVASHQLNSTAHKISQALLVMEEGLAFTALGIGGLSAESLLFGRHETMQLPNTVQGWFELFLSNTVFAAALRGSRYVAKRFVPVEVKEERDAPMDEIDRAFEQGFRLRKPEETIPGTEGTRWSHLETRARTERIIVTADGEVAKLKVYDTLYEWPADFRLSVAVVEKGGETYGLRLMLQLENSTGKPSTERYATDSNSVEILDPFLAPKMIEMILGENSTNESFVRLRAFFGLMLTRQPGALLFGELPAGRQHPAQTLVLKDTAMPIEAMQFRLSDQKSEFIQDARLLLANRPDLAKSTSAHLLDGALDVVLVKGLDHKGTYVAHCLLKTFIVRTGTPRSPSYVQYWVVEGRASDGTRFVDGYQRIQAALRAQGSRPLEEYIHDFYRKRISSEAEGD